MGGSRPTVALGIKGLEAGSLFFSLLRYDCASIIIVVVIVVVVWLSSSPSPPPAPPPPAPAPPHCHAIQVSGEFLLWWEDCRTCWNSTGHEMELVLPEGVHPWYPQAYIPNARDSTMGSLTIPHTKFHVTAYGSVRQSTKFRDTVQCKFDLTYMPFDRQYCTIIYQVDYSAYEVDLDLPPHPVSLSPDNPLGTLEWQVSVHCVAFEDSC